MNSLCLKRINKDLKELIESPLDGIGIISLDNDPKKYIVNIKIMSGVYEGYCIQLLLTFPDNYPIHPPKILIYPGQYLDNTYHHHITKLNYIDDKSVLLGYPIKKKNKKNNGTLIPIPEILSYEGYLGESSKNNEEGTSRSQYLEMSDDTRRRLMNAINNLNETERQQFLINEIRNNPDIRIRTRTITSYYSETISYKSANNEFYDSWLPIYINEEHYKKNRTTILNYFSIVKYGNYGLKQYDFRPHYIFEILPNILGSMIKKISLSNVSSSFLKCFFQY